MAVTSPIATTMSAPTVPPRSALLPLRHRLGDGGWALIRPAQSEDRELYAAAVAALSPRARYLRFFAPNPILRERDLDRLLDVRAGHQGVWVAIDETTGAGLGAARWAVDPDGNAEVALAVLDAVQGRGLGGALLDQAILGARQSGFRTVVAETLTDNSAAAGLLASRGLRVTSAARGVASWRLPLVAIASGPARR